MGKILHTLHLYLGLLAALVLMVVGLSGAILSYEKELLGMLHKESFRVEPTKEGKLAIEQIVNRFLEVKQDAKINSFTLSKDADSSYVINIASKESRKGDNFYINPYTAEILPDVSSHKFFKWVENLHRRLLLGEVGKGIVGASVLTLLFLLVSGIYMYMPKIKRGFVDALKIHPKAKGRAFLYTLHGSVGLWVVPFYLVISLSGLYWSYDWYNKMLHAMSGVEKPERPQMQKPPAQGEQGAKTEQRLDAKRLNGVQTQVNGAMIAKAFGVFDTFVENCYAQATLRMSQKENEYTVVYIDKQPAHVYARNQLAFNVASMELLKHERYNDKNLSARLMASMFALHSGEFFGWIGQLFFFLAALVMPLFGISGLMIYMKKRKKKA